MADNDLVAQYLLDRYVTPIKETSEALAGSAVQPTLSGIEGMRTAVRNILGRGDGTTPQEASARATQKAYESMIPTTPASREMMGRTFGIIGSLADKYQDAKDAIGSTWVGHKVPVPGFIATAADVATHPIENIQKLVSKYAGNDAGYLSGTGLNLAANFAIPESAAGDASKAAAGAAEGAKAYTKATIPASHLDPALHPASFTPPPNAISRVALDPETGQQIAHVTSIPRGIGIQNIRMDVHPDYRGSGVAQDLLQDAVSDAHSHGLPYRSDTQVSVPAAKVHEKVPGFVRNEDVSLSQDPHDGQVGISNNGRPIYDYPVAPSADDAQVGESPQFDPNGFAEGGEAGAAASALEGISDFHLPDADGLFRGQARMFQPTTAVKLGPGPEAATGATYKPAGGIVDDTTDTSDFADGGRAEAGVAASAVEGMADFAKTLAQKYPQIAAKYPDNPQALVNFDKFIGNSKVQQPVYHGTAASSSPKGAVGAAIDADNFATFRPSNYDNFGVHFGSNANQANDRLYMKGNHDAPGRLIQAYIKANNPYRIEDMGHWNADSMLIKMQQRAEDHARAQKGSYPDDTPMGQMAGQPNPFPNMHPDALRNKLIDENRVPNADDIINLLRANGYDSVVYANKGESSVLPDLRDKEQAARQAMQDYASSVGKPLSANAMLGQEALNKLANSDPQAEQLLKNWRDAKYAISQHNVLTEPAQDSYIVLDPVNQVRGAIGNNGDFGSTGDPDFNKAKGGLIRKYAGGGGADGEGEAGLAASALEGVSDFSKYLRGAPNQHAVQLADMTAAKGHVAYNPSDGTIHSSGYAIPVSPDASAPSIGGPPSADEIHDFMIQHEPKFADPNNALLTEKDDEGDYHMHVAHVEPDFTTSIQKARSWKAPGVHDIATGQNYGAGTPINDEADQFVARERGISPQTARDLVIQGKIPLIRPR